MSDILAPQPDDKFLDGLLKTLSEAPRTQIDEDIIADILKFMSETHSTQEKYDFIQNISREPLNMIDDHMGVGRITPFVQIACDLDAIFSNKPKEKPKGPFRFNGPYPSCRLPIPPITVEYLLAHQDEKKYCDAMTDIMEYHEYLVEEKKFDVLDQYIEDFSKAENMCFQYYVCVLSTTMWVKDNLTKRQLLIDGAIQAGMREKVGDKRSVMKVLKGLI